MEPAARAVNPWNSMWTRPRETVRHLVETDPKRMVLVLAALAGVSQMLNRASIKSLGDTLSTPVILLAALLLGPLFGIVALYIGGALIAWTGKWIGGSAPASHIRTALAWGNLPIAASLVVWVADLALFGHDNFTTAKPRLQASHGLSFLLMLSGLVSAVLGIWAIVLMVKGVGEVQGFSAWKALGNVLLAGLVLVVPIIVLGIAAAVLIPGF